MKTIIAGTCLILGFCFYQTSYGGQLLPGDNLVSTNDNFAPRPQFNLGFSDSHNFVVTIDDSAVTGTDSASDSSDAVSAPAAAPAPAPKVVKELSKETAKTLARIGELYRNNNCDDHLGSQVGDALVAACSDAINNPSNIESKNINNDSVSCFYDSQVMTVAFKGGQEPMPQFQVTPTGDVTKISTGDLAVASDECKVMEKSRAPSSGHPASEELCLSYFPDKYFSRFQNQNECSEMNKVSKSAHVTRR